MYNSVPNELNLRNYKVLLNTDSELHKESDSVKTPQVIRCYGQVKSKVWKSALSGSP